MTNMKQITLYSTLFCPYCIAAKQLLNSKGMKFTEIRVDKDREQRQIMIQKSGRTSVPQIFIDEQHIGGFDDLYAFNKAGLLDKAL